MSESFSKLPIIERIKVRGKVLRFKKQLENADNIKVDFGPKGQLIIIVEKDCKCEDDEIGTGVMEEFTETHTFTIDILDINLNISADN